MNADQKYWYNLFLIISIIITPIVMVFKGGIVAIITWWVFYIALGILIVKRPFVPKSKVATEEETEETVVLSRWILEQELKKGGDILDIIDECREYVIYRYHQRNKIMSLERYIKMLIEKFDDLIIDDIWYENKDFDNVYFKIKGKDGLPCMTKKKLEERENERQNGTQDQDGK